MTMIHRPERRKKKKIIPIYYCLMKLLKKREINRKIRVIFLKLCSCNEKWKKKKKAFDIFSSCIAYFIYLVSVGLNCACGSFYCLIRVGSLREREKIRRGSSHCMLWNVESYKFVSSCQRKCFCGLLQPRDELEYTPRNSTKLSCPWEFQKFTMWKTILINHTDEL